MSKILLVDIETAPNIAYVWGAWKQNVGANQWINKSHIMSFAAKWLGSDTIIYEENRKSNDKNIIRSLVELLDSADIVVAHNGKRFDFPVILGRAVVHGLAPPSPYHIVDTRLVASKHFRFASNSLENLANDLGLSKKGGHKKFPGFELWLECLRNNDDAWAEMKEYNIQDVVTLEELYLTFRPYISDHPNVLHESEEEFACPKCGSHHVQRRGYYRTKMGLIYPRFQCNDCGGWGRGRYSVKDINSSNSRNAV